MKNEIAKALLTGLKNEEDDELDAHFMEQASKIEKEDMLLDPDDDDSDEEEEMGKQDRKSLVGMSMLHVKPSPFKYRVKNLPGYGKKDGVAPPAPPKPPANPNEPGFTGKIKDSIGRNRCYQNGVPVHCNTIGEQEDGEAPQQQEGQQGQQQQGQGENEYEYKEEGREHAPAPQGEKLTKAPCCLYTPNPEEINPETGLTESRIGVKSNLVPPPPDEIGRMPNLTERERKAETDFADAYLSNPDGYVDAYKQKRNHTIGFSSKVDPKSVEALANKAKQAGLKAKIQYKHDKDGNITGSSLELLAANFEAETGVEPKLDAFIKENNLKGGSKYEIGDAPNIFNTDDVKALSPDYNPPGVSDDENKNARGVFNLAVHQTANALAKRAFIDYLDSDEFKNLPDEKKFVLVTSGGVAAGKGYALGNAEETVTLQKLAGAVWDAAGEQNAAENPWVLAECRKRGIKSKFAFIHADPIKTFENEERGVVQRANNQGRMVDARVFADSYEQGAKNFKRFMDENIDAEDVEFYIINNATGGQPQSMTEFPEEALSVDGEALYERASRVLQERAEQLRPSVVRGGSIGQRVWGKSKASGKSLLYKRTKVLQGHIRMKAMGKDDPITQALLAGIAYNNENFEREDADAFERSMLVTPVSKSKKKGKQEPKKENDDDRMPKSDAKQSPFKKKSFDASSFKDAAKKHSEAQQKYKIMIDAFNRLDSGRSTLKEAQYEFSVYGDKPKSKEAMRKLADKAKQDFLDATAEMAKANDWARTNGKS